LTIAGSVDAVLGWSLSIPAVILGVIAIFTRVWSLECAAAATFGAGICIMVLGLIRQIQAVYALRRYRRSPDYRHLVD
jgi:membrane protein YdbS with pleckstrin-like domain